MVDEKTSERTLHSPKFGGLPTRVGFLSLGLMGSPLAGLLKSEAGCKILVPELSQRSADSQSRAEQFGLDGVESLESLFEDGEPQISFFISVLPPSEALLLATKVAGLTSDFDESSSQTLLARPIYVDLNAISPSTSLEISKTLHGRGWEYVCGSIIGMPPRNDGFRPSIYLSGEEKSVEKFKALGEKATWKVTVLENSGIGGSKALKLSYSMLTKGIMGLTATSMLAAASYSDSTTSALASELSQSLPGFLPFLSRQMENVTPKSGRFVGEFEEIASYVNSALELPASNSHSSAATSHSSAATDSSGLDSPSFRPGDMFKSMAKLWTWFSRSQGKEERHRTLVEGQEMLKKVTKRL